MVMELKLVPAVMLLLLLNCDAPLGNTKSSPATGAVPPQLPAVPQLLSAPPPLQVRVTPNVGADQRSHTITRQPIRSQCLVLSCGIARPIRSVTFEWMILRTFSDHFCFLFSSRSWMEARPAFEVPKRSKRFDSFDEIVK